LQSKPIFAYIMFGTVLRYLQDARGGWKVHGEYGVEDNLRALFHYLDDFKLPVTIRASGELQEFHDELKSTDADHRLTSEEASRLTKMIDAVRNTLEAEALGNIAFIVTDKRIDVNKLLNSMGSLMAPKVFDSLPEVAKYDFTECGKCIAFERPTAAAFHILRGTEDVLRMFYCALVKRNRVSPLLWGPVVDSLKRKRTPPPIELLNNLDNIRRSFRNPTQHPDKVYDIQEVQDLFGLCIDAINRMIGYLKTKALI
jgi:hypothetical protein